MAQINLLPWREERRKQQQQDFGKALLASAALAAAMMLFVHTNIAGRIEGQGERNQFLKTEIASLDRKIKEIETLETDKQRLVDKMGVIQDLQGSRPEIVHLFDELAKTAPTGVYLNTMKQTGRKLVIDGLAQSNARVSAYMRRLESSRWLQSPSLQVIETKDKSNRSKKSRFTLEVTQAQDKKKGAEI